MNKWKNLLIAISSNRIWFITFMCLDLFFNVYFRTDY